MQQEPPLCLFGLLLKDVSCFVVLGLLAPPEQGRQRFICQEVHMCLFASLEHCMLCYSECMGFLKASLLHLAGTHIQAGRRGEMYSARLKDMCVFLWIPTHPEQARHRALLLC